MLIKQSIAVILTLLFCSSPLFAQTKMPVMVPAYANKEHYVGTVQFDSISIRLIVLKHCFEGVANRDAEGAIEVANLARSEGLDIKEIGNYHITKDGKAEGKERFAWETVADLKTFVSEQMKIDAQPGDTFIIHTIGHGGGGGGLQYIGQRQILVDAFTQAAEENDQETVWWQLSCHAAAKLPPISSLTPKQQELFSMLASSSAKDLSWFGSQPPQMKLVFEAMAKQSAAIDPDRDGVVTSGEFKNFLNKEVKAGRGDLFFAKSDDEPIFGFNLANAIPIIDHNRPQQVYPRNYIPRARR